MQIEFTSETELCIAGTIEEIGRMEVLTQNLDAVEGSESSAGGPECGGMVIHFRKPVWRAGIEAPKEDDSEDDQGGDQQTVD